MPTLFVGLHLALAGLYGLTGLSFLLDPCGGGGDLCLGGYVGLLGLALAVVGCVGVAIWVSQRRAALLLLWDAFLVTIGAFVFLTSSGATSIVSLTALFTIVLGVPAGVLAGRAVAQHRLEPLLATAMLVATSLLGLETGTVVTVVGVLALAIGWLLNRSESNAAAALPAAPTDAPPR